LKAHRLLIAALTGCVVTACGDHDAPPAQPRALTDALAPAGFPAGPVTEAAPRDNALTEARAQLGKRLFFEVRLSRTNQVSCGSCHRQEHAFSDPSPVSEGVDGLIGKRNAPSLANLAWGESFFWDGRSPTLEDQAGKPIQDPHEMDAALGDVVSELSRDSTYEEAFLAAYGTGPTELTLRQALASFVRTLVSGSSPYDRFVRGDQTALDGPALRGQKLFFGERGDCFHCHAPGMLTNEGFFNNGTFEEGGDIGREAVTGRAGDRGKFKVPGLRNVALTAPYMHDGSLDTLKDVIEHYARGGRGHPTTDPQIKPLTLSARDKKDLLAFLESLTDETFVTDARFRP
jgi:cytochrome c peroxidase